MTKFHIFSCLLIFISAALFAVEQSAGTKLNSGIAATNTVVDGNIKTVPTAIATKVKTSGKTVEKIIKETQATVASTTNYYTSPSYYKSIAGKTVEEIVKEAQIAASTPTSTANKAVVKDITNY